VQRGGAAVSGSAGSESAAAEDYLDTLIARSRRHPTPAFWISAGRVRSNYNRFARGLPGFRVFFPLKACSHPSVLGTVFQEGASFDAASLLEIRILTGLGVPAERIAFTTPIKPAGEIRRAAGFGVRCFVADCAMEVEKLAAEAGARSGS
jgi:ornithine decarboxylase